MQVPSNRSIVIISSLLTLLILGGATLAVGFHKGWLRAGSPAPAGDALTIRTQATDAGGSVTPATDLPLSTVSPAAGGATDEAAAYRQKLDEAYRALEEAYAQIRVLQAPQSRFASIADSGATSTDDDRDDDRRERRSHRNSDND